MAQTTPPTVDPLPPTPSTSSPTTFATLMDALLVKLDPYRTQLVALALNVYNNALDAFNSAAAAFSSATDAASSATAAASAAATANVTKWISGTSYAAGACVWSLVNGVTYRRITAGAGTTDPSADPTNWLPPILGGFTNLVLATSTQSWTPPAGVIKAEITVINGGWSSSTSTANPSAGRGADASISVITVSSSVTYTATVGAGGLGPAAGTDITSQAGGNSSFSGTGITTLTTANGALKIPGGGAISTGSSTPHGGGSLYCPTTTTGTPGYGGGARSTSVGGAGINGGPGLVIIRY